jgi:glycosyltransferase involved in cell wall biosynthesis
VNLATITPVILTYNEAPNIGRTLAALAWAPEVVVVDSLSTDATVELAGAHRNVRIVARPFDTHAAQWNFAIGETGIATEWILCLDADYVVPAELVDELRALEPPQSTAGYRTRFAYCIEGRMLKGSVYPPVITLFRRGHGRYRQDGHTQRLDLDGQAADLVQPIRHDDRKPFSRWLSSQHRYMELEAEKLSMAPSAQLSLADRIRKLLLVAPGLVFLYVLFVKGAILDGRAGLAYALQRAIAEMILTHHLVARRLRR